MRAISSVLCVPFVLAAACADFETTVPEQEAAPAEEPAMVFAEPSGFIDHANAVPDSYIVVLKPSRRAATRAELDATIDRLAGGAAVHARYEHAVRGFAASMTAADARALAADPDVAYVEANQRMTADYITTSNATWGIDRIDQASLPLDTKFIALGDSGSTVTAYVFDTGIRATHIEFTGRLLPGFDAVADGQGTNDCNGHGTHVSGTVGGYVLGVAKKVSIVPVRTLGCESGGTLQGFLSGVDWVVANKRPRAVANMSLAFNPPNDTVDNAVRRLITNGVTVVVSAGNNNTDACTQSPARVPEAITVAATDKLDKRATFSNYGTCVDLFAPGVDIQSASYLVDNQLRVISGTSQATPHVTGVAALYLSSHPTATPAMIAAAITGGTTQNKVIDPMGSVNRLLSSKVSDTTVPTVAITAPASGATVDASFTVSATAADTNLARVVLKVDGVEVATAPAAPAGTYELAAAGVAPGAHMLEVIAIDLADLTTTSTLDITVRGGNSPTPGDDPNEEQPTETVGGCNTGGGTPGVLALAMALFAIRRRRRA